jgi:hypothetical protein
MPSKGKGEQARGHWWSCGGCDMLEISRLSGKLNESGRFRYSR